MCAPLLFRFTSFATRCDRTLLPVRCFTLLDRLARVNVATCGTFGKSHHVKLHVIHRKIGRDFCAGRITSSSCAFTSICIENMEMTDDRGNNRRLLEHPLSLNN